MNYKGLHCVVDADSICYAAGYAECVEEMRNTIDKKYMARICEVLEPRSMSGYMEAISNKFIWRNFVAVERGYKSNRVDRVPPQFKDEAKLYFHEAYRFKFCSFYESEDAVSMEAHTLGWRNCVKCGIDGDLLTCPGTFLNYSGTKWKLPYYTEIDEHIIVVDEEQAKRNFYTQMIQGDAQDAIGGLGYGFGPKAAEKVVRDCPVDELPYAVARMYIAQGHGYHRYIEMARLLKILERRDEVCTPLLQDEWAQLEKE